MGQNWTKQIGYKEANVGHAMKHNTFIEHAIKCYGYSNIQNLTLYIRFAQFGFAPCPDLPLGSV